MGLIKFLGQCKLNRKRKKLNKINMSIDARYHHGESGKGADIWGSDWTIPVAEEFEWHFFDDTETGKQYITTRLTDYIFWLIPFTYDQYVYEVPGGTFAKGELTTKKVAELIYFLEHWNWHTDQVRYDDNVNWLQLHSDEYWNNYTMGNNDYSFIRTK